jgi:hypothetical protein
MSEDNGHFRAYQSPKGMRQSTLDMISGINQIVEEYEKHGLTLTVRQIYYQFVSRGWGPSGGRLYDQVQGAANTGRNCGLISWTAIEDRGRNLMGLGHYTSPASAIARVRGSYRIDMWANQPFRPEFWVEKQALEGVVGQMANQLEVDYYAQKGYNSTSEHWAAGQRFARYIAKGQRPIVFHLGDHDPSGWHMTQSNIEKLSMYAGVPIMVQRLALNADQIDRWSPPPFETKTNDSRYESFAAYMEGRGRDPSESHELDALDPLALHAVMEDAVRRIRDPEAWDQMLMQQTEDKRLLDEMIETLGGAGEDEDV